MSHPQGVPSNNDFEQPAPAYERVPSENTNQTVLSPPNGVQQPEPAYNIESSKTTAQDNSPAPVKDMPTSPMQSEQTPWPLEGQKGGPGVAPLGNSTMATPLDMLGDSPQWIDCPFCKTRAMTSITKEGTGMQVVLGGVLCLFCVCLACVPCLAGWCEDTHYSCTTCNRRVATRSYQSGRIEVLGPQNHGVVPTQYQSEARPAAEK